MSTDFSREFSSFEGLEVSSWLGHEMALAEDYGNCGVLWQHASVPFLQFGAIELSLSNGTFRRKQGTRYSSVIDRSVCGQKGR